MSQNSDISEQLHASLEEKWRELQQAKSVAKAIKGELLRAQQKNGPEIESLRRQSDLVRLEKVAALNHAATAFLHCNYNEVRRQRLRARQLQEVVRTLHPKRRLLISEIEYIRIRLAAAQKACEEKRQTLRDASHELEEYNRLQRLERLSEARREAAIHRISYKVGGLKIVSSSSDDTTHLYFGGDGEPVGPGHAHYVIEGGRFTYIRSPGETHGPHNHVA